MPEIIEELSKLLEKSNEIMVKRHTALNQQNKPFTLSTPNYAEFKAAYDLIKLLTETITEQKKLKQNKKYLNEKNNENRTNEETLNRQLDAVNKSLPRMEAAIKEAQKSSKITYDKPPNFKASNPDSQKLIVDLLSFISNKISNFTSLEKNSINEYAIDYLPEEKSSDATLDKLRQTITTQTVLHSIEMTKKQANPITKINTIELAIRNRENYKDFFKTEYNDAVTDALGKIKAEIIKINKQDNLLPEDKALAILKYVHGEGTTSGITNKNHISVVFNDPEIKTMMQALEQATIKKINDEKLPIEIDELERLEKLSKQYQNNEIIIQNINELKKTTTNSLLTKINSLTTMNDITTVLQSINLHLKNNLDYPNADIKAALATLQKLHQNKFDQNLLTISKDNDISDPYQKLQYIDMLIKFTGDNNYANNESVISLQKELVKNAITKLETDQSKHDLKALEQIRYLIQLSDKLGLPTENVNTIQAKAENNIVQNLQAESINLMSAININEFNEVDAFAKKSKRDKIPTLGPCIDLQENVTYTLQNYILSGQNPTEVASRISQVIRMTNQFRESNNYYMFMACASSLSSSSIMNLNRILEIIPEKEKGHLKDILDLISPLAAFKNLQAAYNTSANNSTYVPALAPMFQQITNFDGVMQKKERSAGDEADFDREYRDRIFDLAAQFRKFQVNHATLPITQSFPNITANIEDIENNANQISTRLRSQSNQLHSQGKLKQLPPSIELKSSILDMQSYIQFIPKMTVIDALTEVSRRIQVANKILVFENESQIAYEEKVRKVEEDARNSNKEIPKMEPYKSKLDPIEKRNITIVRDISQLQKEMITAAQAGDKTTVEAKWKILQTKALQLYEGTPQEQINNQRSSFTYIQAANKAYYDLATKSLNLQVAPESLQVPPQPVVLKPIEPKQEPKVQVSEAPISQRQSEQSPEIILESIIKEPNKSDVHTENDNKAQQTVVLNSQPQNELDKLFVGKLDPKLISADNIDKYIAELASRISAADKIETNADDISRTNLRRSSEDKLPQLNASELKNIHLVREYSDILKTMLQAAKEGNDTLFAIQKRQLDHYDARVKNELTQNQPTFNYLQEAKESYMQIASNILQQKMSESSKATITQAKESVKALDNLSNSFEQIKKTLATGNLNKKDKLKMRDDLKQIKSELNSYLTNKDTKIQIMATNLKSHINLYTEKLDKTTSRDWIKTLAQIWEKFLYYVGLSITPPKASNSTNKIGASTHNQAAKNGEPSDNIKEKQVIEMKSNLRSNTTPSIHASNHIVKDVKNEKGKEHAPTSPRIGRGL